MNIEEIEAKAWLHANSPRSLSNVPLGTATHLLTIKNPCPICGKPAGSFCVGATIHVARKKLDSQWRERRKVWRRNAQARF